MFLIDSLARFVHELGLFAVMGVFAFEVYALLQRVHANGLMAFENVMISILRGGILRYPMTDPLASKADRFV